MKISNTNLTGFFVSGPIQLGHQLLLERLIPGCSATAVGKGLGLLFVLPFYCLTIYFLVVRKVGANMLLGPVFIAITFATNEVLLGSDSKKVLTKITNDVPPAWLAGFLYWPAVLFCSYRYLSVFEALYQRGIYAYQFVFIKRWVPVSNQAIVIGMAGAFWNVYISSQANKKTPEDIDKDPDNV